MITLPITNSTLEFNSIKDKYLKAFEKNPDDSIITNNIYVRIKHEHDNSTSKPFQEFLSYFMDNSFEELNNCLIGDILEIERIISDVEKIISGRFEFTELGGNGKIKSNDFGITVLRIFGYSWLRRNEQILKILSKVSTKTCPYCNQNELQFIFKKNSVKALLDIDHFYTKVYYPYLSASFHNLIPSCHTCNSSYKGTKKFTVSDSIYPYVDSFDNMAGFTIGDSVIKHPKFYGFNIGMKYSAMNNKVKSHITSFGILERYKDYKDEVLNIWRIANDYDDDFIDKMVEKHKKEFPHFTREMYIDLCLSGSLRSDKILDNPKGKLIKDMAIHFGITY